MTLQPHTGSEQAFAVQYAQMSESELLTFAITYDSLSDPARCALRAEFSRRRLEPPLIEEPTELAESSSRNLTTIRSYRDLSEAIVARAMIESAGIFCFLQNENTIRLDWQISNFIGGIRLQVSAQDVEAAIELLDQPIPDSIAFEGMDYEQPHCPTCESTDISFEGSNRKAALASLYLLSIPLPLGGSSWICHHCGSRWVDEDETATLRRKRNSSWISQGRTTLQKRLPCLTLIRSRIK